MSIIDKVVAAVTPPESEETRLKARAKARAWAGKGDWLTMVLNHHEQIESAFASVKAAADPASRVRTLRKLSTLLGVTPHCQPQGHQELVRPEVMCTDPARRSP